MPDMDRDPVEGALQQLQRLADAGGARAHGLPAEQVRVLGVRRHRRRVAATVAAASVAVAVFTGGALAATGELVRNSPRPQPAGTLPPSVVPSTPTATATPTRPPAEPSTEPSPAPASPTTVRRVEDVTPPGGWVTEIPAGFRVDEGLPSEGDVTITGPAGDLEVPAFRVCGRNAYPIGADAVDRLSVWAEGPEYRETRELTLYPDAAAARRALGRFVDAVLTCPRERTGTGGWQQRSIVESGVGESGYVVVQNYGQRGLGLVLGTYSSHLVRVGNALVFVERLGEAEPGSEGEVRFWAQVRRTATAITADMCVFGSDPCRGRRGPVNPAPQEGGSGAVPRPGASPEPEPEPVRRLPRSVLLGPAQTWYHERGDLRVVQTVHGEGAGYISVCQRGALASLGPEEVWRRDFAFRRGEGTVIRSAALQFGNTATAEAAYDTLRGWADQCRRAVLGRGFERFSDRGRWYDVAARAGSARFRSGMTYGPVEGDPYREMAYFDDQGVVLRGDRVLLLTLAVGGYDWNWAFAEEDREQTGLAMHPFFRLLSEAAGNLGR